MRAPKLALLSSAVAVAALVAGCGSGEYNGVKVPTTAGQTASCPAVQKSAGQIYCGAVLFNQHCSGCHTISAANARGSRPGGNPNVSERTNGPNFDVRHENREDVLYAIRNGGFSGAIMPANVVVGQDAQDVALFLERYAGSKSQSTGQSTQGTATK
jgi:mono/diheme cytochrome c family protein